MKTKKLIEKNLDLIFGFEKYVLEHPEFAAKIPKDAVVFMQIVGDPKFNRWTERQAKKQAGKESRLVLITVKKLRPVRSRIDALNLEFAA